MEEAFEGESAEEFGIHAVVDGGGVVSLSDDNGDDDDVDDGGDLCWCW